MHVCVHAMWCGCVVYLYTGVRLSNWNGRVRCKMSGSEQTRKTLLSWYSWSLFSQKDWFKSWFFSNAIHRGTSWCLPFFLQNWSFYNNSTNLLLDFSLGWGILCKILNRYKLLEIKTKAFKLVLVNILNSIPSQIFQNKST